MLRMIHLKLKAFKTPPREIQLISILNDSILKKIFSRGT